MKYTSFSVHGLALATFMEAKTVDLLKLSATHMNSVCMISIKGKRDAGERHFLWFTQKALFSHCTNLTIMVFLIGFSSPPFEPKMMTFDSS